MKYLLLCSTLFLFGCEECLEYTKVPVTTYIKVGFVLVPSTHMQDVCTKYKDE